MCSSPLLSVCMITYNHASFIRQAVESTLGQETDFEFEVVIGDDYSQDGNSATLLELQSRFPRTIHLLLARENLGRYTGNGRLNFLRTFRACRGKYLAVLDGDDYWTDTEKLQKQVDFLEAHPNCSACFHDAKIVFEEGGPERPYMKWKKKQFYSLEDLLDHYDVPTLSIVYRRQLIPKWPEWLFRIANGDWAMMILLAEKGEIGFLNECMGTYRVHEGGVWSAGNLAPGGGEEDVIQSKKLIIKRIHAHIRSIEIFNQYLQFHYDTRVRKKVSTLYLDLVWVHQCTHDWKNMRRYLWKAVRYTPLLPSRSHWLILKHSLIAAFPQLYLVAKRFFRREVRT